MRITMEPAWLLRTRPWRDTSMLLEGFSAAHGRVGLVARGVRAPRGRWRGLLQPFQPLYLGWSGRGELATLSMAEAAGAACTLRGDTLLSGYYMNELLMRLLERNDPHPRLFEAYGAALQGLQDGPPARALRLFEKRLLDELGYGLPLSHTADTGEVVVAGARYHFDVQRGPLQSGAGLPEVSGATLLALESESLQDPAQQREARYILRAALDAHLGPRPLRTREMLAEYKR